MAMCEITLLFYHFTEARRMQHQSTIERRSREEERRVNRETLLTKLYDSAQGEKTE